MTRRTRGDVADSGDDFGASSGERRSLIRRSTTGGAGHVDSSNPKLRPFLEEALAIRRLTEAEGASDTSEQQAGHLAGTVDVEANDETIGILPRTQPGCNGGRMRTATKHHNRTGLRRRGRYARLPKKTIILRE